ncbi:endo alpha-1,4 polygalactosaminidase [Anaeromicrobium sediminis]|uniref:Glycoside-hydrolase family GH114 TIM-barrel domain-containing protein n=1 Tax=Anaeromicrobium sediminis TaxID=1478221 RepID=A0A267ME49_9FIRM|nr:endo alpha-1,4 polygalactosaminidase [Anaeromicrobium sediminis]PAB57747.1 hypothetical protein CCE28_18160 [Anaeromicrobium sediminis]
MKGSVYTTFIVIILALFLLTGTDDEVLALSYDYGVFIGSSPREIRKLSKYEEVVIDGFYFTKENIDYLHKKGVKVYSYINIGSLEEFRPYYNNFKNITLDDYENWHDEKWIDVSNEQWQNYLVNTLAKDLSDKGIDGFFIDNVDVYSIYKNSETFDGVYTILNTLNTSYNKPIIINGGYEFINKAFSENINVDNFLYGMNQEEVYTSIDDYKYNIFSKKSNTDINYTIEYLSSLKDHGFNIYVIEYSKNRRLNRKITNIYRDLNFKAYVSRSIDL